jgi:hypothetical protein
VGCCPPRSTGCRRCRTHYRLSALQDALMGERRGSLKVQTQLQPLQQE